MLRAFLILLSFMTDYELLANVAQRAFAQGLINASLLGCIGGLLAVRRWLANRSQAGSTFGSGQ